MDLDALLDAMQDEFGIEEKVSSRTMPSLERAPGKNDNWVEKNGGLPKYIERIAKHLHYEQGMSIGHAIAAAVNTVKRWARGGDNVKPDTRAKAQAALAEWEAKKAKSKAGKKDAMGDLVDAEFTGIEYKNVGVKGLRVADESQGIVEAIVSVTGIVDEVKDIIKPGAYAKTLAKRLPKGVFSHAWDQPISKTLEIKELMPGDPRLPKKLANGEPWPKNAGALWVKTQFNLDGDRGRQAFSDVKFYGDQQEWSIGYNVPVGGAKVNTKTGQREIDTLDLFEYSPVLFGAMPLAATQSVKSAQEAFKAMQGQGMWTTPDHARYDDQTEEVVEEEVEEKELPTDDADTSDDTVEDDAVDGEIELAEESTEVEDNLDDDDVIGVYSMDEDGNIEKIELDEGIDDDESELDEYEPVEAEDTGIKAYFGPEDLDLVRKALRALDTLLGGDGYEAKAHSQVPGDEVDDSEPEEDDDDEKDDNPSSVKQAVIAWLPDADDGMIEAAEALDDALGNSDGDLVDSAANDLLDMIEQRQDAGDDDEEALSKVAELIAKLVEAADGKEPLSEGVEEKEMDFEDDGPTEVVDLSGLDELRAFLDADA